MDKDQRYDEGTLRVILNSGRCDANESVYFARQLEYIKTKTFDVKRPNLSAFARFPISTEIPEGATTHTYRQYDTVGMAKVVANYANDMPRADVTAKEFTLPIRSISNSYGYNVQELRSSLMTGVNLPSKKATAATRAHQEKINQLAFSGESESGLVGLFGNTNIPEVTLAADGTGSSKTFASKTSTQIVRDIQALINKVKTQSKGIHQPNEVWLPIDQYAYIAGLQNSAASDTTVLEFLKRNNPGVEFYQIVELSGAGASSSNRMYALENSIENWQMEIPMMIKQYAPQQQGLEFVIPVESRFGGVPIEYPLAFAFADGI